MKAEDLVFWLDVLRDAYSLDSGVLCQRHADSMVVPRGWTLDDIRDPDLHLFRPPAPTDRASVPHRRRAAKAPPGEQLEFSVGSGDGIVGDAHVAAGESSPTVEPENAEDSDPSESPSEAWTPTFDENDDLDGLLTARSPLLARAFRGADRPAPN